MSQLISDSVVLHSAESLNSSKSIAPMYDKSVESDPDWSTVLTKAFRDPLKLLEYLELDTEVYLQKIQLDNPFKMLVPLSYVAKIKKGDWHDPLLRQVLPLKEETQKRLVLSPIRWEI